MLDRLRARLSRDRLLVAALALAWLAALSPLARARFLPWFDFPAHLVHIGIWHRLPDPSWHYQDFYRPSLHLIPYWGYWFPVHLLAYVLPIELANKVYLSLYAAALPASVIVLGKRFGRSPWIGLLAFPLVWSWALSYGFIGYSMAWALALCTLAWIDLCLDGLTAGRLAVLLALALATYFTHFLPWLVMGICAAPLLLLRLRPIGRSLPIAAALLSTAALAAANLRRAADANLYGIAASGGVHLGMIEGRSELPMDAIRMIPKRVLMGMTGGGEGWALAGLMATAVLLLVTARRRGAGRFARRDLLPIAWTGIALAGYLIVPFYLFRPVHWWNAGGRLVAPAVLFGLLALRGPIEGRMRWLLAPAFACAIFFPIALGGRFAAFDGRLAGLVRLMERVPRGASTLTVIVGDATDPALPPELQPWRAVHSYPQFLRGGFDPHQYRNGFPFRLIEGRELPAPSWLDPEVVKPEVAARYDFVLTRGEHEDGEVFGAIAPRPSPVARDGMFRLYATRRP